MNRNLIFIILILSSHFMYSQEKYFGFSVPGLKAKIFAPKFISTEKIHNGVFHPNGKEFYFNHRYTIMLSKMIDGKWTKPEPAPIPGDYREVGPFITRDGSKLFYSSDRPVKESDLLTRNIDMWYLERDGDTWGPPIHLGKEVNTEGSDWFPNISDNGTLYFYTHNSKKRSGEIFYAEKKDGKYQKGIFIEGVENDKYDTYDPFIAPDESYMIFASSRRPDGLGDADLYICFRDEDGKWSKPRNMGDGVNSPKSEFAPLLTPDGKYLFFARDAYTYWVDAKIIEKLK